MTSIDGLFPELSFSETEPTVPDLVSPDAFAGCFVTLVADSVSAGLPAMFAARVGGVTGLLAVSTFALGLSGEEFEGTATLGDGFCATTGNGSVLVLLSV